MPFAKNEIWNVFGNQKRGNLNKWTTNFQKALEAKKLIETIEKKTKNLQNVLEAKKLGQPTSHPDVSIRSQTPAVMEVILKKNDLS